MSILKQFLRVGRGSYVYVVYQPQRTHRSGADAQAAVHPLGTGKTQFALVQHVLQGMDVKVFVAFETHQIMAVSLMVAEEQILAMK